MVARFWAEAAWEKVERTWQSQVPPGGDQGRHWWVPAETWSGRRPFQVQRSRMELTVLAVMGCPWP